MNRISNIDLWMTLKTHHKEQNLLPRVQLSQGERSSMSTMNEASDDSTIKEKKTVSTSELTGEGLQAQSEKNV